QEHGGRLPGTVIIVAVLVVRGCDNRGIGALPGPVDPVVTGDQADRVAVGAFPCRPGVIHVVGTAHLDHGGIGGVYRVEFAGSAGQDSGRVPLLRAVVRPVDLVGRSVEDVVAGGSRAGVLAAPPHVYAIIVDQQRRSVVVHRVSRTSRDDTVAVAFLIDRQRYGVFRCRRRGGRRVRHPVVEHRGTRVGTFGATCRHGQQRDRQPSCTDCPCGQSHTASAGHRLVASLVYGSPPRPVRTRWSWTTSV